MPTNRELYFSLLKENNKYLNRTVINSFLCEVNGFKNNQELYLNFDKECINIEKLNSYLDRARTGEPYQYILEKASFIDLTLKVNKHVLIPRQETEGLVLEVERMIKKFLEKEKLTIGDVCTGSGAIGLYLKKDLNKSLVYLSDIDGNCLKVAKENSERLNLDVELLKGDLLEPFISREIELDVLVCNPPYIESEATIDEQVWRYEPHLALLANPKTKFYEEIFKASYKIMSKDNIMAFEIGEDMEDELTVLVENYFPQSAYRISKDMYGKVRYLVIITKEDGNYV